MKEKTINKVISNKFKTYLESVDDPDLKNLIEDNTIITGGCITSMLLNEPVNDYDLYFTNKDLVVKIAEYYVKKFIELNGNPKSIYGDITLQVREEEDRVKIVAKSSGVASEENSEDYRFFELLDPGNPETEEFIDEIATVFKGELKKKEPKFRPIFLSSNAITLSDKIQIIIRFYGDPFLIHKNFDFVHCTNYWDSRTRKLILNHEAIKSILVKDLRYVGSKYPICSLMRMKKFVKNGWSCTAGQIFKICYQVSKLNLDDFKVLEDQLTGVDVAYFSELLRILKEDSDKGKKIDETYIMELVDKIF
jgi:hypothetical protein